MGRPPKPTVLKLLEGNRGKRSTNKREPQPPAKVPPCPAWLDAEAKLCWRRLTKILHPIGLLTVADGDSLAMYCTAWARWLAAERVLKAEGLTMSYTDSQGNTRVKERPEVGLSHSTLDTLMKLAREFGMTPAARSRMMVLPKEAKDKDKWEGLLADAS